MRNEKSEILLQACSEKNITCIARCLAEGANPNCKDEFGNNPLTLLMQCHVDAIFAKKFPSLDSPAGLLPGVEALIQAGAKINSRSSAGKTSLYEAVENHNDVVALRLIELGANVNASDRRTGYSILMKAVQNNLENVVNSLLANGADTSAKSGKGKTRAGKQVMSFIHVDSSLSLVRSLVQHGADPKADNSYCLVIAIHRAARYRDFTLAHELIKLGADINARGNANGETQLMFLARYGKKEEHFLEARIWLELGSDPNLTNDFGQTALDIALECENVNIASAISPL